MTLCAACCGTGFAELGNCRECAGTGTHPPEYDHEPLDSLLPYFGPEDTEVAL